MENASKALIIAGAILLAILIIGLGVYIYNQAANVMGNTGMDQLAIQQFNDQFESYVGTKSGSQVKQLLKVVKSNNYTHMDDTSMQVTVNLKEVPDSSSYYYGNDLIKVGSGKMYTVTIAADDRNNKNGIIKNIEILEASATH